MRTMEVAKLRADKKKLKETYLALKNSLGQDDQIKFKEKAQLLEKNLDQIQ